MTDGSSFAMQIPCPPRLPSFGVGGVLRQVSMRSSLQGHGSCAGLVLSQPPRGLSQQFVTAGLPTISSPAPPDDCLQAWGWKGWWDYCVLVFLIRCNVQDGGLPVTHPGH